jgi:hypothetical protein
MCLATKKSLKYPPHGCRGAGQARHVAGLLSKHRRLQSSSSSASNPRNSTMPREADLSTNERDFTLQVLRNGMRLDGRARDAFRPIELTFGDEYGAVDLRLGKTQYVPYVIRPNTDATGSPCACPARSRSRTRTASSKGCSTSSANFRPWPPPPTRSVGAFRLTDGPSSTG